MAKLIATLFMALTQIVAPCATCGLDHAKIQQGYVIETFGNSAIFEVQDGELIEWYLGDEPVMVQIGDAITIVDCKLYAVNGEKLGGMENER